MKTKGILCTIASAVIFGVTPVLSSLTFAMGSNAATLTFYRNLSAIPVLLVLLWARRISLRLNRKEALAILLVSLLGAATGITLSSSYNYVGVGTATTLHFLYPVFVVLICRIFFRERLGKVKTIALAGATLGIVFFFEQSGDMKVLGIVIALLSGVTYAGYLVGIERMGIKDMNPFKLAFYIALVVAVIMLFYDIPTGAIIFDISPKALLLTCIVGISCTIVAFILLQLGIRSLGASMASILSMFEPISSVFAGWLFLGEGFGVSKLIGCVVILGAVTALVAADKIAARKNTLLPETEESIIEF